MNIVTRFGSVAWRWHRVACVLLAAFLGFGCDGDHRAAGEVAGEARPSDAVERADRVQHQADERLATTAGLGSGAVDKTILFGDLHVHTTYSIDAFMLSLPLLGGDGARPPADACDFARHCAGLDFFAITDHAASLTPENWAATKESVRQCNARWEGASDPDMVAFTGFEWTQSGKTPRTHYGHKNVIFPGDGEDALPARPIAAGANDRELFEWLSARSSKAWLVDPLNWRDYADFSWHLDRVTAPTLCEPLSDSTALPADCLEIARTPQVLYRKLDEWGLDALVIPHGTAWGMNAPPDASFDHQLTRSAFDPERERLIEIMSGHGSSEEFRRWRAFETNDAGERSCPVPTPGHLACCWRAGEIARERCGDLPEAQCEKRVQRTIQRALESPATVTRLFPDAEWLDCGQCRDCFKAASDYRPGGSVQAAMALSNFQEADESGEPLRFGYGFVASSDDHAARAATGFKQVQRLGRTDARGARSEFVAEQVKGVLSERLASFLYPGGVVAVHSESRSRDGIWQALNRREVYGTSGPRMLLWFDLVDDSAARYPMGSSVARSRAPRFEVRAVGSFVQKPGCPEDSGRGLPPERFEHLCQGECDHPGDTRHPIVAIEIVRIRPQQRAGEPIDGLIEDPWRRFECEQGPVGCVVRFQDDEFEASGRDALYYVRALQETTPAINGANLRAERGPDGRTVAVDPCYGDYRTPAEDDCLAPVMERAWSSPIFVSHSGVD